MKNTILTISLLFATTTYSRSQDIIRLENENSETFMNRIIPDSMQFAHQIIETKNWDTLSGVIIVFYGYDDTNDINIGFNQIYGHAFLSQDSIKYRDISFGPIFEEGGMPEIISISFANADKDKVKELLVLCTYDQKHYDYSGTFYETFIFDNPDKSDKLHFFNDLSERFYGCECSFRNGQVKKAKYKTIKEIKKQLSKMGY